MEDTKKNSKMNEIGILITINNNKWLHQLTQTFVWQGRRRCK